MAKKEEELYKEWIEEVSGKLKSEDEKRAFELFSNSDAGRETLRGGMRRAEFDRRLNELHETRRQLETAAEDLKSNDSAIREWYAKEKPKNEELVKELETLKSRLREFSDDDAPPPSAQTFAQTPFSKEELEALKEKVKKVDLFDANLPRLQGEMFAIIKQSLKEGFDVDPRDVIAYATKNRVDPFRAYEDLTYEARQEKFEKDRDEALKKAKEEGRREALSNLKSSPDHMRTPGPSIVDRLQGTELYATKRERVDAAVRDFLEGSTT